MTPHLHSTHVEGCYRCELSQDEVARWWVTEAGAYKRIHSGLCSYGKRPYAWAGDRSRDELLAALVETGAVMWHVGCKRCCLGLDSLIRKAQREHVRSVILEHLGLEASR